MSRQPESLYLNGIMKPLTGRIHWEKTHNIYRGGTPDVYASASRSLWIEFKYSKLLRSIKLHGTVQPCLTELQHRWLCGRHEEGRRVAVCVGFPQGGLFVLPNEFDRRIPLAELEQRIEKRKVLTARLRDYLTGASDELALKIV